VTQEGAQPWSARQDWAVAQGLLQPLPPLVS
jgi:hypothetical protein